MAMFVAKRALSGSAIHSSSTPPPPPSAAPTPPPQRSYGNYALAPVAAGKGSGKIMIDDSRWKFQPESHFPAPRPFEGRKRVYRSGRGSSVPLDLSVLVG